MFTIKCSKCKKKLFKYVKVGKGRLWHCWKERIVEDFTIRKGDRVMCLCGNEIGVNKGRYIKLRRHSFTYKGSIDTKA
ncbi:MAG: hypothetical protein E3J78_03975 [Candidatus Cloacimonadota bacterium]|nr:MAG: hypothetical protein E3J78_03975 [Candidatus Cloacimonadota bacterium]